MQVTNCIIDQMTSKIYALRKKSVITVVFMSLASSRESCPLNDPSRTRCSSTVFPSLSLSNQCSSADEIVSVRDSFALNSSLRSLIFFENIARLFLRISSAFGAMGGGGWLKC